MFYIYSHLCSQATDIHTLHCVVLYHHIFYCQGVSGLSLYMGYGYSCSVTSVCHNRLKTLITPTWWMHSICIDVNIHIRKPGILPDRNAIASHVIHSLITSTKFQQSKVKWYLICYIKLISITELLVGYPTLYINMLSFMPQILWLLGLYILFNPSEP